LRIEFYDLPSPPVPLDQDMTADGKRDLAPGVNRSAQARRAPRHKSPPP
jgi:hypothetical protein